MTWKSMPNVEYVNTVLRLYARNEEKAVALTDALWEQQLPGGDMQLSKDATRLTIDGAWDFGVFTHILQRYIDIVDDHEGFLVQGAEPGVIAIENCEILWGERLYAIDLAPLYPEQMRKAIQEEALNV